MKPLIIIGTGPSARQVYDFNARHRLFQALAFAVDRKYLKDTTYLGLPVYELETLRQRIDVNETELFVSLGWNRLNAERRSLYERLKQAGFRLANLISPLAVIRGQVDGDNCWVNDYAVLQSNAKIKSDVIIREQAVIGNDTEIGEHVFVGIRALVAGGCRIGGQSFIGVNATVFDGTTIGEKCIIGGCAVVKRDVPRNTVCKTKLDSTLVKTYDEGVIENKLIAAQNIRISEGPNTPSAIPRKRQLQLCCLDILKAIKTVCEREGLQYTLAYGTLLGAVRHQGFIPWDDDIDVWMPRKDYERFIAIANDCLPEHYRTLYYTDFAYPEKPLIHLLRVVDTKTKLLNHKETWVRARTEINPWVDIIPLDGMPQKKLRQRLHCCHYQLLYVLRQISWYEEFVVRHKPHRPFYERLAVKFIEATHIGRNWDTCAILRRTHAMLQKYDYDTSDSIAALLVHYKRKGILPKAWFKERTFVPFEGELFPIPAAYDAILRHYYGDYMTPPENIAEEGERHHVEYPAGVPSVS